MSLLLCKYIEDIFSFIISDFKFKVVLEALKERKILEELGVEFEVAPN